MALLNPYCTVAKVRSELRNSIASGQAGHVTDPVIEDAINAASRLIDEHKGRDYLYHNHSVTPLHIGRHSEAVFGDTLFLPYRPIITLTVVEVQGETWTVDEDYVVSADGESLVSIARDAWPVGATAEYWTQLTGTFGYLQAAATDVPTGLPARIEKACVIIAANLTGYAQKDVRGLDGAPVSILDKTIPKEAMRLLGPRRLMV